VRFEFTLARLVARRHMQRLSRPYIIGRDLIWKMELACFSTREPLATTNCHIGVALFIFIIVISPATHLSRCYIFIYTHTHTYIYIYKCVCVSLLVGNTYIYICTRTNNFSVYKCILYNVYYLYIYTLSCIVHS